MFTLTNNQCNTLRGRIKGKFCATNLMLHSLWNAVTHNYNFVSVTLFKAPLLAIHFCVIRLAITVTTTIKR